ncbi:Dabb family protein [Micrococcales bacterium 31B]|nr:Dabb family protein [Micrococcales bacterium 31B]
MRHNVLFTLRPAVEDVLRDELVSIMCRFLEGQSFSVSWWLGVDRGLHPESASLALCVDFDSWEAFTAYQECPEHQEVLATLQPHLERRVAAQCDVIASGL